MMDIRTKKENGELFVSLKGSLNVSSSALLDKKLREEIKDVNEVTIDAAELEYISSSGLRAILSAASCLEENDRGHVKLINANDVVREVMEVSGFDSFVEVIYQ